MLMDFEIADYLQLFSEVDLAYSASGEALHRGEHFLEEALRLWEEEHGRPSLVTLQALNILSVSYGWPLYHSALCTSN